MDFYSVDTTNAFALLGEDDQDGAADNSVDAASGKKQREAVSGQRGGRGSVVRGRGGGAGRSGKRSEALQKDSYFETDSREISKAAGARGRGGRGRGGPPGRSKRQYDRRDGTGRGHESEKRHGGGKGNWGVAEDELPEKTGGPSGWDVTDEAVEIQLAEGEKPEDPDEEAEGEEEKKEEARQVYTLAEYEEMMKEKMLPPVPVKKETPSVDKKQFDGMAVLKKSQEESGFEGLQVEKRKKTKEKSEKEIETIPISFKVGDPIRRGRGRGRGRGRDFDSEYNPHQSSEGAGTSSAPRGNFEGRPFRGRRGRGRRGTYGERAGRQPRGIDIASENAFPALTG